MSQPHVLSNQQIARAVLVVVIGFLASGVLGLLRAAVISATFGAGGALDAFSWAQRFPEFIFVLVAGGALGSSFIPVFARYREQDEAQAWRLASAVMTLSALAAAVLSIAIVAFTPQIVGGILAPAAEPEVQQLTSNLMRIMMLSPVIFSISGLVMGILHSYQRFLLPSLAISMNPVGLIIGAVIIAPALPPDPGIAQVGSANVYGLAYGTLLSAILHLVVQLPGLGQIRARLRFLPDLNVPGVKAVLGLMGPRVLGLAVWQINFIVNAAFTSGMVAGSASALTFAFTLMFFALGVIGQSVGSATFPTLSALAAAQDFDGFKDSLANALRSVLFLAFPAIVMLILLSEPLVQVLLQRNAWTPEDTRATAWALTFYATGIAGFALLEVLSRAFYALEDSWTPVKIGSAAMIANLVLSVLLIRVIGQPESLARGPFGGLALANALATNLEALALWWLLLRRIGSIQDSYILSGAARTLIAALAMGAMILLLNRLLENQAALLILLTNGALGGMVFFAVSWALRLEEATAIPTLLLRRIRRR